MAGEPYCGNCGYQLTGLTESSKCPECGKPLVEVLQRGAMLFRGRRYKSEIEIFGLPLVHIAFGPNESERMGKARGIIALGDQAVGFLAIGGLARGFIAIGGFAMGLIALGGFAFGLLGALGGFAIGGLACGGGAVGGIAVGGGAIGFIAQGGGAVGYYARGGGAFGKHVCNFMVRDPDAVAVFNRFSWLMGDNFNGIAMFTPGVWIVVLGVSLAILLGLIIAGPYARATKKNAN
jgi:hypothetical protein